MQKIFLTAIILLAGISVSAEELTVPSGQRFKAVMGTTLHSETSKKGQSVTCVLNEDFIYEEQVIAPAGSTLTGTIDNISKAELGRINGTVSVKFNMITTGDGTQIPVSAIIRTRNNNGVFSGGTKNLSKQDTGHTKAVTDAGAGALIGAILSPFTGAVAGKGTMVATVVGAGNEATVAAYTMGEEVLVPIHSDVEIVLVQPIKVTAEETKPSN